MPIGRSTSDERSHERVTAAIAAVQSRIRKSGSTPLAEQNTKASLIEPVLAALGWDIHDPDEVHREFKPLPRDCPVDYALKVNGTPRVLVEAKALGEDLTDRRAIGQVLGYAVVAGVRWCVLTDGNVYRLYNTTHDSDADGKFFWSVQIDKDPVDAVIPVLQALSPGSVDSGALEEAWGNHHRARALAAVLEDFLAGGDEGFNRLIRSRVPALKRADTATALASIRTTVDITSPFAAVTQRVELITAGNSDSEDTGEVRKTLRDLVRDGTLSAPLPLFCKYRGKLLEATLLEDGAVVFNGKRYSTCSRAAIAARESVVGRRLSTNGWRFWSFRDRGGKVSTLHHVRK